MRLHRRKRLNWWYLGSVSDENSSYHSKEESIILAKTEKETEELPKELDPENCKLKDEKAILTLKKIHKNMNF